MPVLVLAFLDQGCFKAKNCVMQCVFMSAMVKRISALHYRLGFFLHCSLLSHLHIIQWATNVFVTDICSLVLA